MERYKSFEKMEVLNLHPVTFPNQILLKEYELAIMERTLFFEHTKEIYYPADKSRHEQELKKEILRRLNRA